MLFGREWKLLFKLEFQFSIYCLYCFNIKFNVGSKKRNCANSLHNAYMYQFVLKTFRLVNASLLYSEE